MKVIGVYLSGRMGNQMFQYAFAKALKMAQGGEGRLILNFKRVLRCGKKENGFEDALQYFQVEDYQTEKKNLVFHYGSVRQIAWYILYLVHIKLFPRYRNAPFWFALLRKVGLCYSDYNDNRYSNFEQMFHQRVSWKSAICSGKYENPLFFDHLRPVILKEFTPKQPPLEENKALYDLMAQTNSVCVSIRRGDYVSAHFKDKFYVCDEQYYVKAIELMKQKLENPVFFFFSDDIEWVKEVIKTDVTAYYEQGGGPVWEKMRLMYSCKHFIISNSTFAWWGQYLSRNTEKVVIAPDHWFNGQDPSMAFLLSDNFIKIPC